jgi:hypothetical protein
MSFTLNLGFGGLCLCVPDPDSLHPVQMHVLLPPCDHGEEHFQVLVYDKAALTPGQPHQGEIDQPLLLTNAEIVLTGVSQAPPLEPPPAEVVNLTDLFEARVPRPLLEESDTGGVLASRVRFDAGIADIAPCGGGDVWYFPDPEPRRLPIRVIWRIQVDESPLVVRITGINGSTATEERTLHFDPAKETLDLWVFNSPADQIPLELPPLTTLEEPDPRDRAEHFACFYDVTQSTGLPVPLYKRPAPRIPQECFKTTGEPGLDVMCITAQALPNP